MYEVYDTYYFVYQLLLYRQQSVYQIQIRRSSAVQQQCSVWTERVLFCLYSSSSTYHIIRKQTKHKDLFCFIFRPQQARQPPRSPARQAINGCHRGKLDHAPTYIEGTHGKTALPCVQLAPLLCRRWGHHIAPQQRSMYVAATSGIRTCVFLCNFQNCQPKTAGWFDVGY